MVARLSLLLFPVFLVLSIGQERTLPTITVCDLIKNPVPYNGGIVGIRGVPTSTDHGLYLAGEGCLGITTPSGWVWAPAISIVDASNRAQAKGRTLDGLQKAFEKIQAANRAAAKK